MAVTLTLKTSGSTSATSSADTTASVTLSGNPILMVILSKMIQNNFGAVTITWNGGGGQAIDGVGGVSTVDGAGTDDAYCHIRYLDAPTAGTGTITINHSLIASDRHWYLYEVSGHDTSSGTAWRDTFAGSTTNAGTTHTAAVTSAVGDYPFFAIGLFQSASSPALSLNGSSTQVDTIANSTFRSYILTGTGAASVTLGGTTGSNTQSAFRYFNINAAAGGGGGAPDRVRQGQTALRAAAARRGARAMQLAALVGVAVQGLARVVGGGAAGISGGTGLTSSPAAQHQFASRLRRIRRRR